MYGYSSTFYYLNYCYILISKKITLVYLLFQWQNNNNLSSIQHNILDSSIILLDFQNYFMVTQQFIWVGKTVCFISCEVKYKYVLIFHKVAT